MLLYDTCTVLSRKCSWDVNNDFWHQWRSLVITTISARAIYRQIPVSYLQTWYARFDRDQCGHSANCLVWAELGKKSGVPGTSNTRNLNMLTCNDAVFDTAQSWHRANRLEYAVFGSKCGALPASRCWHICNSSRDSWIRIFKPKYTKLQFRWIWQGAELTEGNPDDVSCI